MLGLEPFRCLSSVKVLAGQGEQESGRHAQAGEATSAEALTAESAQSPGILDRGLRAGVAAREGADTALQKIEPAGYGGPQPVESLFVLCLKCGR